MTAIKPSRVAVLCACICILLASCSPLTRLEQPVRSEFVFLENGHTLGQTFVGQYRGLQAVSIYLQPGHPGEGTLLLHLKPSPGAGPDIAIAELSLQDVRTENYQRFRFASQADSANRDYYFELELLGSGSVQVGIAPGDTYLDGARYQDNLAQDQQTTFRLVYDSTQVALGLAAEGLTWLAYLLAGAFLFVIPGWALAAIIWRDWGSLPTAGKAGLAIGLSLSLYPLLFLWTSLVGLHLGALYAWLPGAAGLLYLGTVGLQSLRQRAAPAGAWRAAWDCTAMKFNLAGPAWTAHLAPALAFFITTLMVFLVRFWVIRSLDAPLWGDSYQHTLITQLLVDHSGLFNSWEPYTALTTFTYHFGFHTWAAAFHWVTGLSMPQAVLYTGQIINALAVLSLALVAQRLARNPWAGVVTLLVGGLLAPMPMYYVNWGRYTQLAGQAILPAAIFLAWELLDGQKLDWRVAALGWLAWGGLALTHFRVLIFGVVFYLLLFLFRCLQPSGQTTGSSVSRLARQAVVTTGRSLVIAGGAALLFFPWLVHISAGRIFSLLAYQLATPASQAPLAFQQSTVMGDLFTYLPAWAWLLLPVAIGWGLWRRSQETALIGLWWLLNLLSANPHWLNLPGMGAIGSLTVLIAAYFPASILFGAAAGWAVEGLESQQTAMPLRAWSPANLLQVFMTFVIAAAALWGARQRLNDIHPLTYVLFARPDQRAAEWLQQNVPSEALLLVNSFLAYDGTVSVGSDGGWWLPLQARRATTLPPINYASEQGPAPDYLQTVNRLTALVNEKGVADPQTMAEMAQQGITHVYIGQRHGRVNYAGPTLDAQAMLASPYYQVLYHQDRVWVFQFTAPK